MFPAEQNRLLKKLVYDLDMVVLLKGDIMKLDETIQENVITVESVEDALRVYDESSMGKFIRDPQKILDPTRIDKCIVWEL